MQPAPRRVTVRLSPTTHALAVRRAHAEGLSLSHYIRQAVLMRAAWEMGVARGNDVEDYLSPARALRFLSEVDVVECTESTDDEHEDEHGT